MSLLQHSLMTVPARLWGPKHTNTLNPPIFNITVSKRLHKPKLMKLTSTTWLVQRGNQKDFQSGELHEEHLHTTGQQGLSESYSYVLHACMMLAHCRNNGEAA